MQLNRLRQSNYFGQKSYVFFRGMKEEMPCLQDKKDNKKTKKKDLKCGSTGNYLCTGGIEEDNYLQEQVVTRGDTSIYPFSVYSGPGLSGSRFSR